MKTLYRSILDNDDEIISSAQKFADKIRARELVKSIYTGDISDEDWKWLQKQVEVYQPGSDDEFHSLVQIAAHKDKKCSLNWIDTSHIEKMNELFYCSEFDGDISKWNTKMVRNMRFMFAHSKFNGDISKWDVHHVSEMDNMFRDSIFNQDISKWNVSDARIMSFMFHGSKFNQDISKWKVGRVNLMNDMFSGTIRESNPFNQDISKWKINKRARCINMFNKCDIKDEYKPKSLEHNENPV